MHRSPSKDNDLSRERTNKILINQYNTKYICPGCNEAGMVVFYEIKNQPAHSVLLMPTREIALNYPKGDVVLGFCRCCGFISNIAFDPGMHEYSSKYEETQGFSATFNSFHRNLATHLIDRYGLHNKTIIEIGCGKGEFLTLLCELGENSGVGFDPGYVSERNQSNAKDRITFINDLYSEKYANYQGDFVCCKMTLEHIQHTADFVSTVRRSLGERTDTVVFFQVPDVTRILRELAFWDIFYEHCSYFSPVSLVKLFQKCEFDVVDIWKGYDDQYLMIEARPGNGKAGFTQKHANDLKVLTQDVEYFSKNCHDKLDEWKDKLQEIVRSGRRPVIWGSSSKGVSFLTTLDIKDEIEFVVDINPYKHGMYMPGTGQKIVGPAFLKEYKPDVVIVMNPVYLEEIQHDLKEMGLTAGLIPV